MTNHWNREETNRLLGLTLVLSGPSAGAIHRIVSMLANATTYIDTLEREIEDWKKLVDSYKRATEEP